MAGLLQHAAHTRRDVVENSYSYGLVLVCGPTGSGKTTTLYSALSMLNSGEKNIITIEGLSADTSHPVQQSWKELDVPQCGYYCVSLIVQTKADAMEKYVPNIKDMREFNQYTIFRSRVKLLVIMLKAFLDDYTLQGIRLKAIARNAVEVAKICEGWNQYSIQKRSTSGLKECIELDHILHQRISLLAIMAKFIIIRKPMGYYRKRVIWNNISYIVDTLQFNSQAEFTSFIKVA